MWQRDTHMEKLIFYRKIGKKKMHRQESDWFDSNSLNLNLNHESIPIQILHDLILNQ